MSVVVKIPTPLRKFAAGQRRVEVPAGTVGAVLSALVTGSPELADRLYAGDGLLKPTVRVFVGETDIEALGGLAADAADGAVVSIIPPVAGA